jgi:protein-S-isoprenylcysteine O-methyltransferase Ste14
MSSGNTWQIALSAALWCAIHSLLISRVWQTMLAGRLERWRNLSRLAYNLFSVITLAALLWYWSGLPDRLLFDWPGWWQPLRWLGLAGAALLFWLGLRAFDNLTFLGLRQLRRRTPAAVGGQDGLSREGILGRVRHPYYTATMLVLVFSQPVTDVNLVWRAVFLAYLVIGTLLEERKLVHEFGDEYRRYQREVPMFVPRWR